MFPDRQKLASATIFTTAALLVSYRRHGTEKRLRAAAGLMLHCARALAASTSLWTSSL